MQCSLKLFRTVPATDIQKSFSTDATCNNAIECMKNVKCRGTLTLA